MLLHHLGDFDRNLADAAIILFGKANLRITHHTPSTTQQENLLIRAAMPLSASQQQLHTSHTVVWTWPATTLVNGVMWRGAQGAVRLLIRTCTYCASTPKIAFLEATFRRRVRATTVLEVAVEHVELLFPGNNKIPCNTLKKKKRGDTRNAQ
jgi:hypothetical protein